MIADEAFDVLVLPQVLIDPERTPVRARELSQRVERQRKPVCIVATTGWTSGPGLDLYEQDQNIAVFRSFDACSAAIAGLHRVTPRLGRPWEPEVPSASTTTDKLPPRTVIVDPEPRQLLSRYGLQSPREQLVEFDAEAVDAFRCLGSRVVVKGVLDNAPHRREAGLLETCVTSEVELLAALRRLRAAAEHCSGKDALRILVQEQITGRAEIFVGVRDLPVLGPVLVLSAQDRALKGSVYLLCTAGPAEIEEALVDLEPVLNICGGKALEAAVHAVTAISRFCVDHAGSFVELDASPLIVTEAGCIAVDVVIYRQLEEDGSVDARQLIPVDAVPA
jgi:acyl-CoA synthetase (NDP forming)